MPGTTIDQAYFGVIRSHNGPAVGPASGISYNVAVNMPGGTRLLEGIRPAVDRWPDAFNVRPISPATAVWIADVRGQVQLMARELPNAVECPGGNPGITGGESLLQTVRSMTQAERDQLKQELGL